MHPRWEVALLISPRNKRRRDSAHRDARVIDSRVNAFSMDSVEAINDLSTVTVSSADPKNIDYTVFLVNTARVLRQEISKGLRVHESEGSNSDFALESRVRIDLYQLPLKKKFTIRKALLSSFRVLRNRAPRPVKLLLRPFHTRTKEVQGQPRTSDSRETEYPGNIVVVEHNTILSISNLFLAVVFVALHVVQFSWRMHAYLHMAKVKKIAVGDVVASSALRHSSADGTFRFGRVTLLEMLRCYAIVLASRGVTSDFALTPEPTYAHVLLARSCEANGAQFLELGGRGEIRISTSNLVGELRMVTRVSPSETLVPAEHALASVKTFTDKRLGGSLFHRYIVEPRKSEWPQFVTNDITAPIAAETHAVVFLHDFGDAQFIGGLDGFLGLADWAAYTIEKLSNLGVRVIVRPHPHSQYQVNAQALAAVRQRCLSLEHVQYVHPEVPMRHLLEMPQMFGVTHHGTVAIELAGFGTRVIYSSVSPWSTAWHFGDVWHSVSDYAKVIESVARVPVLDSNEARRRKIEAGRFLEAQLPRAGREHAGRGFHDRVIASDPGLQTDFMRVDIYPALCRRLESLSPRERVGYLPDPSRVDFDRNFLQRGT